LYGKWDLSLQTKQKGKRKDKMIILDRNISPSPRHFAFYESVLPESPNEKSVEQTSQHEKKRQETTEKSLPADSIKSHLLPEVLVKGEKGFKEKDMGLRYANIVYDVVEEIDKILDSGESYTEDVQEFLLRTNKYFSLPAMNMLLYKGKPTKFLVNNIPIEDTSWKKPLINDPNIELITDKLTGIKMEDIESIMISEDESLNLNFTKYPIVNQRDSIVIFIYTADKRRQNPQGIRNTSFSGFNLAAEFYSPDYKDIALPLEPDFRRTLYWNPNVKTDKNGKVSVRFYNNATCKELDISAEGITETGVSFVISNKYI
jgi:hypothetical protein